jgi:hypothetical protein
MSSATPEARQAELERLGLGNPCLLRRQGRRLGRAITLLEKEGAICRSAQLKRSRAPRTAAEER